jgi:hypothetical protein
MWEGYFDRVIPDEKLVQALAGQFGLAHSQVLLADSEDWTAGDHVRLVCVRNDRGVRLARRDHFSFQVTLHATSGTPATEVPTAGEKSDAEVMGAICRASGARCLVSDESLSSYSWLLVDEKGDVQQVVVDQASLDDRDELIVNR